MNRAIIPQLSQNQIDAKPWEIRIIKTHMTNTNLHIKNQCSSVIICVQKRRTPLDEQIIKEKLRAFITKELIRDENYHLQDDEGIVSQGLMDSFALAEFGVYVEEEFDVYIPDSDLTVAKMDSLNQMTARVLRG